MRGDLHATVPQVHPLGHIEIAGRIQPRPLERLERLRGKTLWKFGPKRWWLLKILYNKASRTWNKVNTLF